MTITEQTLGKTPDGNDVTRFTLTNSLGLQVELMTYGAGLIAVRSPDRAGNPGEITLGFDDLAGYLGTHPYFAVTVGRYGNRIAGGRFTLDGTDYALARNEAGRHHLHGGNIGFDKVNWRAETGDKSITFHHTSPDGDEGYPGTLDVRLSYALNDESELSIEYWAETDKPTPVNLTNHTYWNLAGADTVLDHEPSIQCSRYLPVDRELIPTGEVAETKGTPLDFSSRHRIGERLAQVQPSEGYDHCFIIDRADSSPAPVLTLHDPSSGRSLELHSTQPAVQIYTAGMLADVRGRGGVVYGQYGGIAIEPEAYPDAVNQPGFPSAIVRPGETYHHISIFRYFTD